MTTDVKRLVMRDEEIEHYKRQYQRIMDIVQEWADLAEYYRNKFNVVKHENNELRKKIYKTNNVGKLPGTLVGFKNGKFHAELLEDADNWCYQECDQESESKRKKQPPPNDQWCVGCSPDDCPGGCSA